jgi:methyl-accepting chemotaxis protein
MFPSSVKGKLVLGFGLLTIINLILGVADYRTIVELDRAAEEKDRNGIERNLIDEIYEASITEANSVRGFLLTGDDGMLKADNAAKRRYSDAFEKLSELAKAGADGAMAAEIRSAHDRYREAADRELQLARQKKSKAALEVLRAQAVPAFHALESAIHNLTTHLDDTKNKVNSAENEEVRDGKLITLGLCAAGTLLGLIMGNLIARSVTTSLAKMIALLQQLAANNLAADDLQMSDQSEIGRAGLALNQMKKSLSEMICSIADTAGHVASASEQISSAASQQAASTGSQKDQTAQVATALQQMAATVQQVSENSGRAAEASRKAADTARLGGGVVEQTLVKMQVIADSVRSSAEKVEELGKRSDQIGRIVSVINDIADQTNLLALNAAIEAARAGEQGRGFAVVADEVRKLAERTTTSTKEIATMIEAVQSETRLAVQAMEEGTQQVAEGVATTQKAGEALKQIIHVSQEVGDMVTHIATAATQQSSATEDINNSMNQIARLLIESADGAQQSEKACQELSALAFDLRKLVGNFRLPGDGVQDVTNSNLAASTRHSSLSKPNSADAPRSFAAMAR